MRWFLSDANVPVYFFQDCGKHCFMTLNFLPHTFQHRLLDFSKTCTVALLGISSREASYRLFLCRCKCSACFMLVSCLFHACFMLVPVVRVLKHCWPTIATLARVRSYCWTSDRGGWSLEIICYIVHAYLHDVSDFNKCQMKLFSGQKHRLHLGLQSPRLGRRKFPLQLYEGLGGCVPVPHRKTFRNISLKQNTFKTFFIDQAAILSPWTAAWPKNRDLDWTESSAWRRSRPATFSGAVQLTLTVAKSKQFLRSWFSSNICQLSM